jgi:hypothetical protein
MVAIASTPATLSVRTGSQCRTSVRTTCALAVPTGSSLWPWAMASQVIALGQAEKAARPCELGHPEAFGPRRDFEFQFLFYFRNDLNLVQTSNIHRKFIPGPKIMKPQK